MGSSEEDSEIMTMDNRRWFLLIVALISPLSSFNFLQAEQPTHPTTRRQSTTAVSPPVSVLDRPRIAYTPQDNAPELALPDPGLNPEGAEAGAVSQRPANVGRMSRQTIRSMDILDRPNRLGHFYGNTVRRRH
jgi:hypothetical protein